MFAARASAVRALVADLDVHRLRAVVANGDLGALDVTAVGATNARHDGDARIEVLDGVDPGDELIPATNGLVKPGQRVRGIVASAPAGGAR